MEAEAISFVRKHTSIPVPRLRYYWEDGDLGTLITDYVEGEPLQRVWQRLSDAQRSAVMHRLRGFVDELRAIPQPRPPAGSNLPPSGWIASPLGSSFSDFMMTTEEGLFGPFKTEKEFYDWHVSTFDRFGSRHPPTAERIKKIRENMPNDHPIVFTHGDINRRNILVKVHGDGDNDVEITALLDWEQAGWRPIYWEGSKWIFADGNTPLWTEYGRNVIGSSYTAEIDLDLELRGISGFVP